VTDERRTIGSGGQAGRGNRSTSPSSAARSLAGGSSRPKKPVTKAKSAAPKPDAPKAPKAAPKPAAKKTSQKSAQKNAPQGPSKPGGPRLRAVTDEDAAAAAAAAAEEAARKTRTAGPGAMPAGIPLDEILVAVAQAAQRVLGSDWEGRLAAFVAALRKRLSGDFAVD